MMLRTCTFFASWCWVGWISLRSYNPWGLDYMNFFCFSFILFVIVLKFPSLSFPPMLPWSLESAMSKKKINKKREGAISMEISTNTILPQVLFVLFCFVFFFNWSLYGLDSNIWIQVLGNGVPLNLLDVSHGNYFHALWNFLSTTWYLWWAL